MHVLEITLQTDEISRRADSAQRAHLPAALLHYCILLTGFGTVFLGPMLPTLTTRLQLSDRGAGTLLAAQFCGSFLGGWTTSAPLQRSMLRGLIAAVCGFGGLAFVVGAEPHLAWALSALFVLGYGIGQTLTAVNLLASAKWAHRRGAALTLLNFTWSLGALTAPLLLLRLLRSASAAAVLTGAAAFLFLGLAATFWRRATPAAQQVADSVSAGLSRRAYVFFCGLLFLYGGVETSLGGWLTTFDHRYNPSGGWQGMAVSTTAFWASLTLTRLLAPVLLRFVPERVLLRAGLATGVAALLAMLNVEGTLAIATCAALAGLALSPWFPLVLSALVAAGAYGVPGGQNHRGVGPGRGGPARGWSARCPRLHGVPAPVALLLPAQPALRWLLLCSASSGASAAHAEPSPPSLKSV